MNSKWYGISANEMDSILELFVGNGILNPPGLAKARERKKDDQLAVFPYEVDYVRMALSEWPEPPI